MPSETVAHFEVTYQQVLDEKGQLDEALEPALDSDTLLRLYRAMVLARESDQRMLKLQRQGRIGTFPLCTGQEASSCAVVLAMEERDWLVPAFRELGAMLMRGVPFEQILAVYAGYEEGNHNPEAARTLPISVPVGSQIPEAAGIAYAMDLLGEPETAVVTFFGDGATSEGDFHEGLNFAAVWNSPAVFVCQNNGWAISLPTREQMVSQTIAQKAIAYGMAYALVDGNDALAVYRAASEALERARSGGGPTLIEAVTYRLMQHTTSDDPRKYRSEDEEQSWWSRDPLPRFRGYLERKGLWDEDKEAAQLEEIKVEIAAAVERFESRSEIKPDAPFDHVFGTSVPTIEEQRAAFLATLGEE